MALQTFCTITGGIAIVCAGVAVLLASIMCFINWLEKRRDRLYYKALEEANRTLGQNMMNDACWMSEYPQVDKFLSLYGRSLKDNFRSDIADVRSDFRKEFPLQ